MAGVAAAPGVITYKDDGHPDRSCAFSSDSPNMVVVTHADGSYAWYLHFKNGSLTPKGVGEPVAQGEYLGTVGSSGSSTGPHLHFEVYDSSGVASWWTRTRGRATASMRHPCGSRSVPISIRL